MAKRHSVLVVDDDDRVRSLYADALEEAGHVVAVASDGVDALDRLQGGAVPCVVLTDVRMPRMDGLELSRAVARDPELAHDPGRARDRRQDPVVQLAGARQAVLDGRARCASCSARVHCTARADEPAGPPPSSAVGLFLLHPVGGDRGDLLGRGVGHLAPHLLEHLLRIDGRRLIDRTQVDGVVEEDVEDSKDRDARTGLPTGPPPALRRGGRREPGSDACPARRA